MRPYTLANTCFTLDSPCTESRKQSLEQHCPETETWFWLIAAALGIALAFGGSR